ncbi:MAG: hypothetical protein AB1806_19160 [Acidobacteriota bacterium]
MRGIAGRWRTGRESPDEGVALVAAVLALGLVSAIALGMAILASTDPAIAANSEGAAAAGYAAEAGLVIAAAELQDIPDWSAVLAGTIRSAVLSDSQAALTLPDGRLLDLVRVTHVLNCGRPTVCTAGQLDQPTAERPWGRNNPRWRVYGHASTGDLWGGDELLPSFHVVAWVGDDPAEEDGAPETDDASEEVPFRGGGGIIYVRTESFGPRGAHAARTGTVLRVPGTPVVRIAAQSTVR